ncbi:MAG: DUF87 domain-containing protein [Candidatus Lokiarchaeota archaeon]|nr:DUF87 domain-containing protein [Candidatus Lokiarchaeota archaeon]
MPLKVGTIFNYNQLPDVSLFPFVIKKRNDGISIRKGLFVYTNTVEGRLVGIVEKILLLNEYFSDALTIKAYNNNNPNILKNLFPSEDFEYTIVFVKCLGIIEFVNNQKKKIKKIKRMTFPARPGAEVFILEEEVLQDFIGFNKETGLNLGKLINSDLEARIDMNKLLNKHFAILSISGGGKSYLTSVLIEELLTRASDLGTPGIVLIDVHGEYTYLNQISDLKNKISVYNSKYFQISVPKLNSWVFRKYQHQLSHVQLRELSNYIQKLKKDKQRKNKYSILDIIEMIQDDEDGNKSTKNALIGWLVELNKLNIFGSEENPNLKKIVNKQQLTIFDLSRETSIRKKQIMIDYLCSRLFYLRRMNKIAPFLLILEEAHQFCPEAAQAKALSKSIIETIAREGRKFMACLCLISQRPKKLSTTALSQLNTKLVLNIKNPYDLKHLMDSSEAISKDHADMISSLGVGEMLIFGNAVNYPTYIEVRERIYNPVKEELSLSQVCADWQKEDLF